MSTSITTKLRPDTDQKRTAEVHIRKVRETETGGQPTPWDDPIKFIFNTQATGFRIKTTFKELYDPVQIQQAEQQEFKLEPNINFINE